MASRRRCCHSARRPGRRRARCPRRPEPGAVWRDQEWAWVRAQLPADLEASARASGALRRRRAVRSAAVLLRLVLADVLSGWPLRLVAAWAAVVGLGHLSDVALLDRLRGTRGWLGALVAGLVADGRTAALGRPVRLRLVEATTVSRPGSTGTDWRVHLSLSLAPLAIDGLELTDGHGAEALGRHPAGPGDIQVADRGHARWPGPPSGWFGSRRRTARSRCVWSPGRSRPRRPRRPGGGCVGPPRRRAGRWTRDRKSTRL